MASVFLVNDLGRAAPALDLSGAFRTEIPHVAHIEIPPMLASLDDWYEAPRAGSSKLLLHI